MNFSSSASGSDQQASIFELARRHGLELAGRVDINELGLDFRIASAVDSSGLPWVLRIPRRPDATRKIQREAAILALLRPRLPFAVPDWRIVADDLIAYPKLTDPTAISVDAATHDMTWHIDADSDAFNRSLGGALAALHGVSVAELAAGDLRTSTSGEARDQIVREIAQVKDAFPMDAGLERRWRAWLDDDTVWPSHSTVIHGDLYAGHVLVNARGEVTGMIDWSEAEIGDPAIDFSSHLLLFGETGLSSLIRHYEAAGGKTWPHMARHVAERLSLAPLKYALFALKSGDPTHLATAKVQLLPG